MSELSRQLAGGDALARVAKAALKLGGPVGRPFERMSVAGGPPRPEVLGRVVDAWAQGELPTLILGLTLCRQACGGGFGPILERLGRQAGVAPPGGEDEEEEATATLVSTRLPAEDDDGAFEKTGAVSEALLSALQELNSELSFGATPSAPPPSAGGLRARHDEPTQAITSGAATPPRGEQSLTDPILTAQDATRVAFSLQALADAERKRGERGREDATQATQNALWPPTGGPEHTAAINLEQRLGELRVGAPIDLRPPEPRPEATELKLDDPEEEEDEGTATLVNKQLGATIAAPALTIELLLGERASLHALCITGPQRLTGGALQWEGVACRRGLDQIEGRRAFCFVGEDELDFVRSRRARFQGGDGAVTPFVAVGQGRGPAPAHGTPHTPPGALWIPPGDVAIPIEGGAPVLKWEPRGLFLSRHPVTHREFMAFLSATGYRPENDTDFLRQAPGGQLPPLLAEHPVVYISLADARAYATWVGGRLPREDELKRAIRGVDGRPWPWGFEWDPSRANTRERREGSTLPVGSLPQGKGPFGHHDLVGNVWIWTETADTRTTPPHHALKGGSWVTDRQMAQIDTMGWALPTTRQFFIGMRVAWDLVERR